MTKPEWLSSTDLLAMLEVLRTVQRLNRKIRLLAVGCTRQVWPSINQKKYRRAIETAERFADGLATTAELDVARDHLRGSIDTTGHRSVTEHISRRKVAFSTCVKQSNGMLNGLANLRLDDELAKVAPGLIRCVIGPDPDRDLSIDPDWLELSVRELAGLIYEIRDDHLMPILGDALEDAGCRDPDFLGHCRGPGPHVRGCWVVDLILGKS